MGTRLNIFGKTLADISDEHKEKIERIRAKMKDKKHSAEMTKALNLMRQFKKEE